MTANEKSYTPLDKWSISCGMPRGKLAADYFRLIVCPVPGPGFRGQFWVGFGRKLVANGPKSGPKLPGSSARGVWWIWVRSQYISG